MHSSHTLEGSAPFSPSPEPIKTSRQHSLIQSLYGELVAACKNSLTLDVPEKPDEFMSLPTDTRKLYIAIRMHCETCIAESGHCISANWADFRLVAISLKLIEWLDIEVLIGDVPKLTELMLTLRARLERWVNILVPGIDRSFFIKASMTRWDGLHAEMPIASPSDVPSPSQDLAYLVRLAAEAGQLATAASDSNSEDSVYSFHADDMDAWLQYGLAAFSARQATPPPRRYTPRSAATDPGLLSPGEIGGDLLRRAFSVEPEMRRMERKYPGVTSVRRVLSADPAWNEEVTPHPLAVQMAKVQQEIDLQQTILGSVSEHAPFMITEVAGQIAALEAEKARLEKNY